MKTKKLVLTSLLMIVGFWLVGDLKIGLGIFFLVWANNVEQKLQEEKK